MAHSLKALRAEFRSYCGKLGIEAEFYTQPTHSGAPHVEIVDDVFHYVVTERGSEFERRKTRDSDEILYWLVYDVVFDLACQYELVNRIEGQDFRRLMFSKKVELMDILKPEWGERVRGHNSRVLSEHPFTDS